MLTVPSGHVKSGGGLQKQMCQVSEHHTFHLYINDIHCLSSHLYNCKLMTFIISALTFTTIINKVQSLPFVLPAYAM